MLAVPEFYFDEAHQGFLWENGRPAALIVHGFPGTPAEMRPLGEALREAGWTVQAPLLPGFGPQIESLPDRHFSEWETAVGEALAALRREHAPVLLIGHSLGGGLALSAAAGQPPDGLVLLAPFWRLTSRLLNTLWPVVSRVLPNIQPFRLIRLDFDNPRVRKGIEIWMPGADLDDPAVQESIRRVAFPTRIFEQVRQAGQAGYRAAGTVSGPVLVVQGRQDMLVSPALTRRLLQRLPETARYLEVEAEHNLPQPDNPSWEQVREAVVAFAASLLQEDEE